MVIPGPDEVVIKIEVAGSNVKDWEHLTSRNISLNSGDDIAGTVHSFGQGARAAAEFHVGDRVAAFHPMFGPGGAYAEYALAPMHTVFKIPERTSFESALSLYKNQDLPPPWSPRTSSSPPVPLIVYGASSALGSFAIKLAKLSNIHPIIAICGGTVHYVSSLIDPPKGDIIPDYRPGVTIMKSAIRSALGHLRVYHALDAISSKGTWIPISQLLAPGDQLSVVSGANKYDEAEIPEGVEIKYTYVGTVHSGAHVAKMPKQPANTEDVQSAPDFAFVLFSYLGMALTRGTFEGHPYKIVPGGLAGVGEGLRELKEGKNKGDKLVYRVTDTTRE